MRLRHWRRRARAILCGGRVVSGHEDVWRRQGREVTVAITLVRMFYVLVMFMVVSGLDSWVGWSKVEALHLVWPVAWIGVVGIQDGIQIVLGMSLFSSVAGALWPHWIVARAAVAVGILFQSALNNSVSGAITSHGLHAYFWVAFWFVFLPGGVMVGRDEERWHRMRFTQVFWCAQATIMLFYTLGGLFKIAAALLQWSQGMAHSFSIDALSRHTAARILEGGQLPPYFSLGELVVERPWIGGIVYPGMILLEAFSFMVAFRPALHRIWAIGLIAMHLGIYFSMTILFSAQGALVALLFLCSPFSADRTDRGVLCQLPVLGNLLRWRASRRPGVARAPR